MKKVLLICLMFVGFVSFATNSVSPELFSNLNESNLNYEISIDQNLEDLAVRCPAHIYYEGHYVTTVWGDTCDDARRAACIYIQNHFGTCPIGY